jgi:hypothetical protein
MCAEVKKKQKNTQKRNTKKKHTIKFKFKSSLSDMLVYIHFRLLAAPGNLIVPCRTIKE